MNDSVKKLRESIKDAFYLNTYISLTSNKEATIENFRKILEISDVCVHLKTSDREIRIWGSGLYVGYYGASGIRIRGSISSIEFVG